MIRFAALNGSCVSRRRLSLLDKPPVSVDTNKASGRVPLPRVFEVAMVPRVCLRVMRPISPSTPLLLQRIRLEVRARETLDCLRYVSLNLASLWTLRLCMLEAALPTPAICSSFLRPMSSVTPLMLQRLRLHRTRLQEKVRESLDCLSLDRLCACPLIHRIHLGVLMWMHVHVILLCPLLLRLGPHLPLLLRLLLLLHMRAPHPCMLHTIRVRTRVGFRVPREGAPKVEFLVRGHTFPPPGGSCYPIRVTWARIGHQAVDGLDESG